MYQRAIKGGGGGTIQLLQKTSIATSGVPRITLKLNGNDLLTSQSISAGVTTDLGMLELHVGDTFTIMSTVVNPEFYLKLDTFYCG